MPSLSLLIKSPIQVLTGSNWLDIESPFMSTFLPLDHSSTKLRLNSHSLTRRWQSFTRGWQSFTRRWNPSQGGGNPSQGGGNPSQGGGIFHKELAILQKEVAILYKEKAILHKEVESFRSKGINIFNETRKKNLKTKKRKRQCLQ